MRQWQDVQLERLLVPFLARSYPVEWRRRLSVAIPNQDPALGDVLGALSLIEANTDKIVARLSRANVYRRIPVKKFVDSWLMEEQEHGRALAHLSALMGSNLASANPKGRRNIRSLLSEPALTLMKPLAAVTEVVFAAGGAINEYIALTAYRYCAERTCDRHAASLLKEIALQEGRHMRFYRNAALVFLESHRVRPLARKVLARMWLPPGMDVLSEVEWLAAMNPLLMDSIFVDKMLKIDALVDTFPGMSELGLMKSFLASRGFVVR